MCHKKKPLSIWIPPDLRNASAYPKSACLHSNSHTSPKAVMSIFSHDMEYKLKAIAEDIRCFTHAGFEESSPDLAGRNCDELSFLLSLD